mgnify:CR=1 FL=1
MREIKFRGKRVDNGEWVYGNYFIYEGDIEDGFIWRDIPQIQQRYGDHYQYFDIINDTIGQYTGLKDKNGREIYEGDIVRTADGNVATIKIGECCPIQVELFCELCGIKKHTVYCLHAYDKDGEYLIEDNKSLEIIGNIYEDRHTKIQN